MKNIIIFIYLIILSSNDCFAFNNFLKVFPTADGNTETELECTEKLNELIKSMLKDNIPLSKHFLINNPSLSFELMIQGAVKNATESAVNECMLENNAKDFNAKLNLTFDDISFDGSYLMNGLAMKILPLIGNGDIQLQLKGLNLATGLKVIPVSGVLFLDKLNISIGVENTEVSIGGLLDDPDVSRLLDRFLGDLIPLVVHGLQAKISHLVENFVMNDPTMSRLQIENILNIAKLLI